MAFLKLKAVEKMTRQSVDLILPIGLIGLSILTLLHCNTLSCDDKNLTEVRFEVKMEEFYTQNPVIGRKIRVVSHPIPQCGVLSDALLTSDQAGILRGGVSVYECPPCQLQDYALEASTDTLVCVNNHPVFSGKNNSFVMRFKPYITLALRLKSRFGDVEIINTRVQPQSSQLRRSITQYEVKNHSFGNRPVDTTVFVKVLPEEPLIITLNGRTSQMAFRDSSSFLPENRPLVYKTFEF
jgi:hypothetical protein